MKRAVRRLVRLPDGTVGVKYIDLDTLLEVIDLTGYQILDTGQDTSEPLQNDNPDDEQVEITPTSGGSSGGPDESDKTPSYTTSAPGATSQAGKFPPAPSSSLPTTGQSQTPVEDDNVGGVTVTPDKEIADAEWADVPDPDGEENVSYGDDGTTTVTDPNNPNRSSVFTELDPTRFDEGINEAVRAATDYGWMDDLTKETNTAFNTEDKKTNTGIYTAAQVNIQKGLAPNFQAVRPEAPTVGSMPARQSTAQSLIDSAVRPEGPASGMPAARQGTTITGRPEAPVGPMPAASPVSGASRSTAGKVGQGLASTVAGRPDAPTVGSMPASREMPSAERFGYNDFGTPSMERFGYEASPERFGRQSVADQIKDVGQQVDKVQKMEMAGSVPTSTNPAGARPEGPVGGMPAAHQTTVTGRPEAPIGRMPAAEWGGTTITGRPETPGSMPSRFGNQMSVPGATKPSTGANAGLAGIYGPKEKEQSTAKSVISGVSKPTSQVSRLTGQEISDMSPARAATLGIVSRTAQEKQAIATMIAGEMTGNQLSNLTSPNADVRAMARTELANIATTVENRANSGIYNGIADTLRPSQYNSLMTTALKNGTVPMDVTKANYAKYSEAILSTLDDFYAGNAVPTDYGLTSYYSAYMAEPPSWSTEAFTRTGQHVFGALPEYAPSTGFMGYREQMAIQGPRGWTPNVGGVDMSAGSMALGRSQDRASVSGYSAGSGNPGIAGGGIGSRTTSGERSSSAGATASGSGGLASYSGGTAGKAARSDASSSVSGASRSTAGKTSSGPSASSGAISGASRSTAGKTSSATGNNTSWGGTGEKV